MVYYSKIKKFKQIGYPLVLVYLHYKQKFIVKTFYNNTTNNITFYIGCDIIVFLVVFSNTQFCMYHYFKTEQIT